MILNPNGDKGEMMNSLMQLVDIGDNSAKNAASNYPICKDATTITLTLNDFDVHRANFLQHRDALSSKSIKNFESTYQIENIKVIKNENKYLILDGWRRILSLSSDIQKIQCELINDEYAYLKERILASKITKRSDYEIFQILKFLIDYQNVTQIDLTEKINLSYEDICNYFYFDKIDQKIINKIDDLSKVSVSTAKVIVELQEQFCNVILRLSSKIRDGISNDELRKLINSSAENNYPRNASNECFFTSSKNQKIRRLKGKRQISFSNTLAKRSIKNKFSKCIQQDFQNFSTELIQL